MREGGSVYSTHYTRLLHKSELWEKEEEEEEETEQVETTCILSKRPVSHQGSASARNFPRASGLPPHCCVFRLQRTSAQSGEE